MATTDLWVYNAENLCVSFFYQVTFIFHLRGGKNKKKKFGLTYGHPINPSHLGHSGHPGHSGQPDHPGHLETRVTLVTLFTLFILVTLVNLVTLFRSANQFYRVECSTVLGFFV